MKELQDQLDKDLFFGFSFDSKSMHGQKVAVVPQAQIVPVTTRGIGFAAHSLFVRIASTIQKLPPCTVYQLYRVALAQFEFRVSQSTHNTYLPENCSLTTYTRPSFSVEMSDILLSMPVNFNLIANIINAVGVLTFGEVTYYPKIPNLPFNPCCVSFSNLRATVMAMANPRHNRVERTDFYNNNPIPGAIWRGIEPPQGRQAQFVPDPVLMNPDQIMPAHYDHTDFQTDVAEVMNLLDVCARKKSNYVNLDIKLNYMSPGQKTLLVSNNMRGDLRIKQPHLDNGGAIDWKHTNLPSGALRKFWCSVPIEVLFAEPT